MFALLTAHSWILDCQFSVFCKNPAIAVFKTRENTSICCAAVEILVISPWKPASDMSYIDNKIHMKIIQLQIDMHFCLPL